MLGWTDLEEVRLAMEHVNHAGNFMDRVLDPLAACLNREAALSIVELRIDPEIQARVEVLAERANEGEPRLKNAPST